MENYLDKKVGDKEREKKQLKPMVLKILDVSVQTMTKDNKPMTKPLVKLFIKHPDNEEPIAISKIKSLIKNRVVTRTLWVIEDEDGNIQKGSALADFMNYLKIKSLKEANGISIDTEIENEENPWLCIKVF